MSAGPSSLACRRPRRSAAGRTRSPGFRRVGIAVPLLALAFACARAATAAQEYPPSILITNWPSWRFTYNWPTKPSWNKETGDLNGIYRRVGVLSGYPYYEGHGGRIQVYFGGVGLRGYRLRINKPNEFGALWTEVARSGLYSDGPVLLGDYANWRKRTDNGTSYYYPSALDSPGDPCSGFVNLAVPTETALSAEPIDLLAGETLLREDDVLVPAPGPDLRFTRRYVSGLDWTNALGPRWTHSLDWRLVETNQYYFRVMTGRGQTFTLEKRPDGQEGWVGYQENNWTALGPTNGEYRIYLPGRLQYAFDTNGVLQRISDPWDNRISLSYTNAYPSNLLIRAEHSNGQHLDFSYTSDRLTRVDTPSTNLFVTFAYNDSGELTNATRTTSSGSEATLYRYAAGGSHSVTQRVNAAGDEFCYSYATNETGNASSTCTNMVMGSGARYRHSVEYHASNAYTVVSYAARGTNQAFTYHYDTNILRVTAIEGPGTTNLVHAFTYDPFRLEVTGETVEDKALGEWIETRSIYDDRHHVTNVAFGYGMEPTDEWIHTWDADYDVVTSITDPEGRKVGIDYTNGSLARLKVHYGSSASYDTTLGYTTSGLVSAATNANGHWVRHYYDAYGFPTSAVSQIGPEVRFRYSRLGHLQEIAFPSDIVDTNDNAVWRATTFDADELGRIRKITYFDDREETFVYDAVGNLTNRTDAAGRSAHYSYLPPRTLQSVARTVGGTNLTLLAFDYDEQFNTLAITDAKGRRVEAYVLDLQDRPTTVTNLEGRTMSVSYGVAGFVNSVTRFDGTTVSNSHDGGGRLAASACPDATVTFTHYKNDLLATASNDVGTVSMTYNQANRITQAAGAAISGTVAYTYFPAGQVSNAASVAGTVVYAYDAAERVSEIAGPEGTFEYTYNTNNGLISAVSFTNAGIAGSFVYDTTDRLTGITWEHDGRVLRSFSHGYNDVDSLTSLTRETGEKAYYGYDGLDRLTRERHVDAESQEISDEHYVYDEVGNRLSKTHGSVGVRYTYASGGNVLTSWAVTNSELGVMLDVMGVADEEIGADSRYGQLWVSNTVAMTPYVEGTNFWAFLLPFDLGTQEVATAVRDVAGNTTYATNWAVLSIVTSASYAFDSAGCLTNVTLTGAGYGKTTDLSWDSLYRLRSVTTNGVLAESYAYDALGRRVSVINAGSTNYLVYDGAHVVAEVDEAGALKRSYTWGPGVDGLLAFTDYTDGEINTYFALTDRLGTVHALADESGEIVESYRFDAWGRVLGVYGAEGTPLARSALGNRHLWQGRLYSWTTGLYHFRARWYDPVTGRWASKDPIGISGGLNQYVFCADNPVNLRDPSGLCSDDLWFDRLGNWSRNRIDGAISWNNNNLPWGAAGLLNSLMELGHGTVALPQAIGHIGEGAGTFAGDPSWETAPGLCSDVSLSAGIVAAALAPVTPRAGGVPHPNPKGQFVVGPNRTTVRIPAGYVAEAARNSNGIVYRPAGSVGNANTIRIMGPTQRFGSGYVRVYNRHGQPLRPITGKPGLNVLTHTGL